LRAIGIDGGKGTKIRNCSITDVGTGVSIKEGEADLDSVTITDHRIGLQSIDSKVTIADSAIIDNGIDVMIQKTPLKVIDSIMEKLAFEGGQMLLQNLDIDTTQVKNRSKSVLRTHNPKESKEDFKIHS
jgi:hypothetical protein